MTPCPALRLTSFSANDIARREGRVVVLLSGPEAFGRLAGFGSELSAALERAVSSKAFEDLKEGEVLSIAWPAGLQAEALDLVKMPDDADAGVMARAGASVSLAAKGRALTVLAGARAHAAVLAEGLLLGAYSYSAQKSKVADAPGDIEILTDDSDAGSEMAATRARVDGVYLARDLVSAPANVLTTTAFAEIARGLEADGVEVEILDEEQLEALGMRLLLSVGQGSDSPSYVAVMRWNGGAEGAKPLALVGKGVVFDTGGISIKPAAGMEEMTMDMGGAAVVTGVMKTIAARRARANVVGLIGLVENMPSGRATRPGDIVASLKGDTVEIINTDAEGRLVLADVLTYAQNRFDPEGVIDLATLTGAIIIGLGHEYAGLFANDDAFAADISEACTATGEGAWRMPLAEAFDKMIKSDLADIKNVGGRAGGSITAAQFLQRFIDEGRPWAHLDIAGVARRDKAHDLGPKGASGWGVRALDAFIRARYEGQA